MPRLVPNPVGEVVDPLRRVELAVAGLSAELADVRSLPAIHGELVKMNETMAAVLEALQGLRHDLGGSPTSDTSTGGKRRGGSPAAR